MLLSSERSVLLLIDIQEKLAPAVSGADAVVRNAGILLDAAAAVAVPVLASEHYPKGIGVTVSALRERLAPESVFEKIHFSCCGEAGFLDRLDATGRDQIVIMGTEAHVCVLQTALALAGQGRNVFLVADAVGSRDPRNAELAVARMRAAGITIVSTEMVVFEWAQRGGTPVFKSLLSLIR
ncbi:isochorismatase family protein [Azospirillum halopraeferens]|uniref:isochorismatase family protein n=1 Tax=Azospirillum halopraeferens TaxID=34010 RepID=UPI0004250968|nr:isochorismatase family protein [Azospirillum halopraeferens]